LAGFSKVRLASLVLAMALLIPVLSPGTSSAVAPPPSATLNVIKHVINDNGGTAVAADFVVRVTSAGVDVAGSPAPGAEAPGTTFILPPGTYAVWENPGNPRYFSYFLGADNEAGTVTLAPGETRTVTITNVYLSDSQWSDLDSPVPVPTAMLRVVKHVINDNGGTAAAGDFQLHVKNELGIDAPDSPAAGVEAPGFVYVLKTGTYTISEVPVAGYTASYGGDGDENGVVQLNAGEMKTVIVTNDDDPPPPVVEEEQPATLQVIKQVVNDDGGTAAASDFWLYVKDAAGVDVEGSPARGVEAPGRTYTLPPGLYTVGEADVEGYGTRFDGDNVSDGIVILLSGDVKTVIVINDDIPVVPQEPETPKTVPIATIDPPIDFSYGYINGYDTGAVGINDPLTREQASASLYRILKQAGRTGGYARPPVSDFADLLTTRWSFVPVEYMLSIGAIPPGEKVNPEEPVTRGEMAKIVALSNNLGHPESIVTFPDLPDSHPYYSYINMLVNYGLLHGYPDGTVHPNDYITRSEYVTMVNRMINRDERYNVEGLPSLYTDLQPGFWAFKELQRASFGFYEQADSQGFFQVDPSIGISKAALDT